MKQAVWARGQATKFIMSDAVPNPCFLSAPSDMIEHMFDSNVLENIDDLPPGTELAGVLASLDWESLSDHDLIRVLRAQDRQVSHYQAGRAWTIDKVAERYQDRYRKGSFEYAEATDGAAAEVGA